MSLWLTQAEIAALPLSGPAYSAVNNAAKASWPAADIADQDSKHDTCVLAGALIAARTGDGTMRAKTAEGLNDAIGTEQGGRTLALGRNLTSYVLAADLIGYREQPFVSWLTVVLDRKLDGMTLKECHEKRGNNWGTMAGAARIARACYLGDVLDLDRAINVFQGWLGDTTHYTGFDWGANDWQADKTKPVGINRKGATIQGHVVDGVLPDDQRRTGGFSWPPPCGNYPRGALGPVLVALEVLRRNGSPECPGWSESAARRAIEWQLSTKDGKKACQFTGDDGWQPYLGRHLYPGIAFPGGNVKAVGKPCAWTAFSHAG